MAVIYGTSYNDNNSFNGLPYSWRPQINGTIYDDEIYALTGNDLVYAYGGNDYVDGWEGYDTIYGGLNNDSLAGWTGNDLLSGEAGDDWLDGAFDHDTLYGGDGNDTLGNSYYPESGNDWMFAGIGNDWVYGGDGDDHIYGDAGNDYIYAGNGYDFLSGGDGNDFLSGGYGGNNYNGGSGIDTVDYHFSVQNITGNLNTGLFQFSGQTVTEQVLNVEHIIAGSGNDSLIGNNYNNILLGNNGNDFLNGGTGADSMYGGPGNDSYYVDINFDTVIEYEPSQGLDTVYYDFPGRGSYTLPANVENLILTNRTTSSTGTGNQLNNVIWGNNYINTLYGGQGNDSIFALGGNEIIFGEAGNDYLDGGTGNDTLSDGFLVGGTSGGRDTLFGNDGNDLLQGGYSTDTLSGGNGDDTLDGSRPWVETSESSVVENDSLVGGGGSDLFRLATSSFNPYLGSHQAYIGDFESCCDYIQVRGNPTSIILTRGNSTYAGNRAILDTFVQTSSRDVLAIILDNTDVSLSRDFIFV